MWLPNCHDMDDLAKGLGKVQVFQGLSPSDLGFLARIGQAEAHEPGEIIIREGGLPTGFYALLSGRVSVVKTTRRGKPKEVATIFPERIFGEVSLFDNYVRSATIVAKDKVHLCFFPKAAFLEAMADFPDVGVKVLLKMGKQLAGVIRSFTSVYADSTPENIAPISIYR